MFRFTHRRASTTARDQAPAFRFGVVGFASASGQGGSDGRALTDQAGITGKPERHIGISSLQLLVILRRLQSGKVICFEEFNDRRHTRIGSHCLRQCAQPCHESFMASRHLFRLLPALFRLGKGALRFWREDFWLGLVVHAPDIAPARSENNAAPN